VCTESIFLHSLVYLYVYEMNTGKVFTCTLQCRVQFSGVYDNYVLHTDVST